MGGAAGAMARRCAGGQAGFLPAAARYHLPGATRSRHGAAARSKRQPTGGTATMAQSAVSYVNPPSAPPVQGMYSHVARVAPGELAFIAGRVAIDGKGNPVGVGDVGSQV